MRVLVTGAASGIGRAAALGFRAGGAVVTALDRNDPGDAADDWVEADLSDLAAIDDLPLDGPYDALVNAAGLPPRPGLEAQVLRVNFFALRALTLRCLDRLAPGSAIVNMASKAGARWRENEEQVRRVSTLDPASLDDFVREEKIDPVRAYDLSKEAVIAWSKAMTAPLIDRGLRMNSVAPAAVETPILQDFVAAFGPRATRGIALTRRSGTPDDIAPVILWLASPASAWLKGAVIEADGGLTAQLDAETYGFTP